jgi:hypothetical protein
MDRARAALARVAPDVCPGEFEILADQLDEKASGLNVRFVSLAVDRERDVLGHQECLLLSDRWLQTGIETVVEWHVEGLRMLAPGRSGIKAFLGGRNPFPPDGARAYDAGTRSTGSIRK